MNKYKNQYHSLVSSSKWSTMVRKRSTTLTLFFIIFLSLISFGIFVPVFALLPSLSSHSLHHHQQQLLPATKKNHGYARKFEISDDKFWKDGQPFQIIGGDLHYFRVLPEYWEDRLLRAKALGLNTIQTYVPWNLHEPRAGTLDFEGIADLVSFLKLSQRLGILVMLRAGPYICAEWDLGGFPPWLLAINPAPRLRSSDPAFLQLVERWWGSLLPKVAPLLYGSGGPIIMVQMEVLGKHLKKAQFVEMLYFQLLTSLLVTTLGLYLSCKRSSMPQGNHPHFLRWLTHWGEKNAQTSADFTAAALKNILERNGSAVLYMAHGGTNFGFYNGANTGSDESDYKPDLTSYDYDAPIRESGDVNNAKFKALRRVVEQYSSVSLPAVPSDNEKKAYGSIHVTKTGNLFELIRYFDVVKSDNPISMESTGQMFGFLLYVTEYTAKDNGGESIVSIPKVHDRAQVFISCPSEDGHGKPTYVGTLERWSNQPLTLPNTKCLSNISLLVLVENMGRLNYGPYIFDRKGILSPVSLDGRILRKWKMYLVPIINLNESPKINPIIRAANSGVITMSAHKRLKLKSGNASKEPAFYAGYFYISKEDIIKDTFISLSGWGKGIVTINNFNIGRFWPLKGPQCNLYVPAPVLQNGKNVVVIFELESPNPELVVQLVDQPDFTCGPRKLNVHQL
ncbi:beta-galactosidase 17 isoform X2 [Prunus dulcis]|uniref:beta-galactosidase 17 isoform X2 n=1 Tax=Prunus dulcis TaxID=3755 RepID=UPI0014837D16|nr:beta-galactosidase 17 isoform X2 [Prunus dulcis]